MQAQLVDLNALLEGWRAAFAASQRALQAAKGDLPPNEVRTRAQRLAEERAETVRLLAQLVGDRRAVPAHGLALVIGANQGGGVETRRAERDLDATLGELLASRRAA